MYGPSVAQDYSVPKDPRPKAKFPMEAPAMPSARSEYLEIDADPEGYATRKAEMERKLKEYSRPPVLKTAEMIEAEKLQVNDPVCGRTVEALLDQIRILEIMGLREVKDSDPVPEFAETYWDMKDEFDLMRRHDRYHQIESKFFIDRTSTEPALTNKGRPIQLRINCWHERAFQEELARMRPIHELNRHSGRERSNSESTLTKITEDASVPDSFDFNSSSVSLAGPDRRLQRFATAPLELTGNDLSSSTSPAEVGLLRGGSAPLNVSSGASTRERRNTTSSSGSAESQASESTIYVEMENEAGRKQKKGLLHAMKSSLLSKNKLQRKGKYTHPNLPGASNSTASITDRPSSLDWNSAIFGPARLRKTGSLRAKPSEGSVGESDGPSWEDTPTGEQILAQNPLVNLDEIDAFVVLFGNKKIEEFEEDEGTESDDEWIDEPLFKLPATCEIASWSKELHDLIPRALDCTDRGYRLQDEFYCKPPPALPIGRLH